MGQIPTGTWVVVADGGKARRLRNAGGEGSALSLKQEQLLDAQAMDGPGPAGHQPPEAVGSNIDAATFVEPMSHG